MAKKVKKQASSASFSLSRRFSKISAAKPSTFIISIIVIMSSVFLFSGGLYLVTTRPILYVYMNNRFYFIFSRSLGGVLGDQFGAETAISNILYVIGFIGLLAIYQSTKHAYKPRQAYIMLVVGSVLLFLTYVFLEYVTGIKLFS